MNELTHILNKGFVINYTGVFTIFYKNKSVITLNTENEVRAFLFGYDFYSESEMQKSKDIPKK